MVVRGPFEVSAVAGNLPGDFGQENTPARRHTPGASGKLGQRGTADVERQRFPEEVRVRAEIPRKVAFDVRELEIQGEQQVDDPRRGACRRLAIVRGEQGERPDPRYGSKRDLEHACPV